MQAALKIESTFSSADFGAFLSKPASELSLDLSNASMLDVISHYEAFKRRTMPTYSADTIRHNITQLGDKRGNKNFHSHTIIPTDTRYNITTFYQ